MDAHAASVWKTKRMARTGGREERVAGNANELVHRPLVSYYQEGVMGSVAACSASFKSHRLHACSSTQLLPVTVITMAKWETDSISVTSSLNMPNILISKLLLNFSFLSPKCDDENYGCCN
jgi:hypothetical protein